MTGVPVIVARPLSRGGQTYSEGDAIELPAAEAVNLLRRGFARTPEEHREHLEREGALATLDETTRERVEAAEVEAARKVDELRARFDAEHRAISAEVEREKREGRIECTASVPLMCHDDPTRLSGHIGEGETVWLRPHVFFGLATRGLVRAVHDHARRVRDAEAAVRECEREQLRAMAETEPAAQRALAAMEGGSR